VLDPGVPTLPLVVATDAEGMFRLETNAFGPGRITFAEAESPGLDVVAVAGRRHDGLRLQR
jgi:hypothetical protein